MQIQPLHFGSTTISYKPAKMRTQKIEGATEVAEVQKIINTHHSDIHWITTDNRQVQTLAEKAGILIQEDGFSWIGGKARRL